MNPFIKPSVGGWIHSSNCRLVDEAIHQTIGWLMNIHPSNLGTNPTFPTVHQVSKQSAAMIQSPHMASCTLWLHWTVPSRTIAALAPPKKPQPI
jgi:hypothetical protein